MCFLPFSFLWLVGYRHADTLPHNQPFFNKTGKIHRLYTGCVQNAMLYTQYIVLVQSDILQELQVTLYTAYDERGTMADSA